MKKTSEDMTGNQKSPFVTLICTRCEFFKEDDIELECAAFKVLKKLLDRGVVTPEDIENAFN